MISPAPYSTDYAAIEERDKCDYGLRITSDMAKNGTAPRKIRVYVYGIFDLFHEGHAKCLHQAKTCFPQCEVYVIAGIPSDSITHKHKGPTVMTDRERAEIIRYHRCVDEVLLDAPMLLPDDFREENKIDFLVHDDVPYVKEPTKEPWSKEDCHLDALNHLGYEGLKAKDLFVGTKRFEGISSTEIISRILKDHEKFLERNLTRGVSKTDLGING